MKFNKYLMLIATAAIAMVSCEDQYSTSYPEKDPLPETYVSDADRKLVDDILHLSTLNQDENYLSLCDSLQAMSDEIRHEYFNSYCKSDIPEAENGYERYNRYFYLHRQSMEKVLDEVKTTEPADGEVHIWLLYNMGYVFKTSEQCFGIDLSHKHAVAFAPYLDFLLISHQHSDHFDQLLINEMNALGKPVISNFVNNQYLSKDPSKFKFGSTRIRTTGGFHNTENFCLIYCVELGEKAGNFKMMHIGDSNYYWYSFEKREWPHFNLFIGPYSHAKQEPDVLLRLKPDYMFVSHISEMRHEMGDRRWTWKQARERSASLEEKGCGRSLAPLVGEHFVWTAEKGLE